MSNYDYKRGLNGHRSWTGNKDQNAGYRAHLRNKDLADRIHSHDDDSSSGSDCDSTPSGPELYPYWTYPGIFFLLWLGSGLLGSLAGLVSVYCFFLAWVTLFTLFVRKFLASQAQLKAQGYVEPRRTAEKISKDFFDWWQFEGSLFLGLVIWGILAAMSPFFRNFWAYALLTLGVHSLYTGPWELFQSRK